MTRHIALANSQNVCFNEQNDGENVNIRIDCYFRAHLKYKRPDVGLKIYQEALEAHENSNQSLSKLHFQ